MNSLLYYSIYSDLTKNKIIEIDERISKNRRAVYLFIKTLSSNYQNQHNKKKKKNSTQVSEERVIEAYQNFILEMNDKGYQANISEDRFLKLSTNPQTGVFDEKSNFEAEGGLQGEVEGLYSNLC